MLHQALTGPQCAGPWGEDETRTITVGVWPATKSMVVGDEAVRLMLHFLSNTGTSETIDLEELHSDCGPAFGDYKDSFSAAITLADSLSFVGSIDVVETQSENVKTGGNEWSPQLETLRGGVPLQSIATYRLMAVFLRPSLSLIIFGTRVIGIPPNLPNNHL